MQVAAFSIVMGLLGLIFFYIGISMGWLYVRRDETPLPPTHALLTARHRQEFMGVVLGSAVVPIAMCITWSKANKWGCIGGAVAGFCAGVTAWLVTTAALNDSVLTVQTTGGDLEMLAGNLASIGVGGIVAVVWSLVVRPFPCAYMPNES